MSIRVFLVEDNPVIREGLVDAMEELAGVEFVGFAEDGATAIGWITANPHGADLLVIDIFLKRGSGIDVLNGSGSSSACKVVLSNYATREMRRRCLDLGAHRVFDKSNELDAFLAYCANLSGDESGGCDPAAA